MILRSFAALLFVAFALPVRADAQNTSYDWEISPRVGAIRHEFATITASHITWGLQVTPFRLGPVGIGASVDGWRDHIPLGSVYRDRTLTANFFVYGLELDASAGEVWGKDVVLSARAGAETVRFGSRYEAAVLFPRYSSSPFGSFGLGARVPLVVLRNAFLLRFETQVRAIYSEIFDPLGIREGRELMFGPAVSIGISYMGQ